MNSQNRATSRFSFLPTRSRQRLAALAVGCAAVIGAGAVSAQSTMSPSEKPPAAQPGATGQSPGMSAPQTQQQPSKQQVDEMFKAADANGDGKLSKEEAKTGMPGVYRNFDRIDTTGKGFITTDDLAVAMKR